MTHDDLGDESFSAVGERLFEDALIDIPRRPLTTIDVGARALDAIRLMDERRVGCVLVVRDGRLAGIFTERDVLTRVAARGLDPASTPITEVMTAEPDTLPHSASVAFALHKMRVEDFRHIPLVDDHGRPVGVVSMKDVVAWMVDFFPKGVLNLPPDPRPPETAEGG